MRTIPTLAALLADIHDHTAALARQTTPAPSSRKRPCPHPPQRTARAAPPSPRPLSLLTTSSWENDRIAHRIYGRALEAAQSPSSSGHRHLGQECALALWTGNCRTGHQHDYQGEGLDFYNVNGARGAGGLGIWFDNKLWTSRNYVRPKILQDGPTTASFEVDYDPGPSMSRARCGRRAVSPCPPAPISRAWCRRSARTNHDALIVGIGISKRPTSETKLGTFTADKTTGRVSGGARPTRPTAPWRLR